jgi:predicted phage terminase large subunit-like protein
LSAAISRSSPAPPDPFLIAADLFDPPADPDRELAERCARSLSFFIREAWPILEPATPFVHGWHVDVVCEHLEAVRAGELLRLIVNIPPRAMKSITAAVCWPAWEWLTAPHIRWLFASYAASLSTRDSLKCRRLIESRGGRADGTLFQRIGYQGVLGLLSDDPWALTGDQNAKTRYDNTSTGFRLATSVGGSATGEGGDRVVVDDPVNPEQARSDAERNAANTWWDETMTTRFNNARAAAVIVMQRLHEEDLTGHLVEKGGWHHLCLPAEYEPSHPFVCPENFTLPEWSYPIQNSDGMVETVTVPGGRVLPGDRRTKAGELLEPVRLGRARLDELLRELRAYGYAGQMQQRPSPAEGGLFKRADLRDWSLQQVGPAMYAVLNTDDGTRRYDYGLCTRFKTVDVAGSSKETADYTVIGLWAVTPHKDLLLERIERQHFDELDVPGFIKRSIQRDGGVVPYIERLGFGSGYIKRLRGEGYAIGKLEADTDKITRSLPAVTICEAHQLFLLNGPDSLGVRGDWRGPYEEELAVFPNGAHDDQVDVTSYAARKMSELASVRGGKRGERPTARPVTAGVMGARM